MLDLKEDKAPGPQSGKERSRNVRSRDLAFSETPWGGAAREFIQSIKKLGEAHWETIYTHAAEFMGRSEQIMDHNDSESNEAIRPRTRIQIDW